VVLVFAFEPHRLDLLEAQPEIDDLDAVLELVAPGVALQRSRDAEPGLVEVVQQQ
jgi:hypothetical protein